MEANAPARLAREAISEADYQASVAHQLAQYESAQIHDLPPISDYWSNTYLRPKMNAVLGVDGIPEFYAEHIREAAGRSDQPVARLLSIGAGDAELEIQIAQRLLSTGFDNFQLEGMELSPILIERANQRIQEAGLEGRVVMVQIDLNSWSPDATNGSYTAVIANHMLHHVVELEALFDTIRVAIGPEGVFLTNDMIGRNGHMRWPEALNIINALWETLPDNLRFNCLWREVDNLFKNWNCLAHGGFEGIRAQDILPLLVERFQFQKFLGFGNLPDVFCDRIYGPNFDPSIPVHTKFIDQVEQLNALLLELGVLKPTMMFAVMSNRADSTPRVWKNLKPQFCIRDTSDIDVIKRQKSEVMTSTFTPEAISFVKGSAGLEVRRRGWSYAEEWGVWMLGKEAGVELPVPAGASRPLTVRVRASAFVPKRLYSRSFTFTVGESIVGGATFYQYEKVPKTFDLEVNVPVEELFLLRILAHEQASPAEDGSADDRNLGMALLELSVF